jgi:hypothetical protein
MVKTPTTIAKQLAASTVQIVDRVKAICGMLG